MGTRARSFFYRKLTVFVLSPVFVHIFVFILLFLWVFSALVPCPTMGDNENSMESATGSQQDYSLVPLLSQAAAKANTWEKSEIDNFCQLFMDDRHNYARMANNDVLPFIARINIKVISYLRVKLADLVLFKYDYFQVHKLIERKGDNKSNNIASDILTLLRIYVEDKVCDRKTFHSIFNDPNKKDSGLKNENATSTLEKHSELLTMIVSKLDQLQQENNELKTQMRTLTTLVTASKQAPTFTTGFHPTSQQLLSQSKQINTSAAPENFSPRPSNNYASVLKRNRPTASPGTTPTPPRPSKTPLLAQRPRELLSFDSFNPSAPSKRIENNEGFKVVGPRQKRRQTDLSKQVGTGPKFYESIVCRKQLVFFGRFQQNTTIETGQQILDEIRTRDGHQLQYSNLKLRTLQSGKVAFFFEIDYAKREIIKHQDIWPLGSIVNYTSDPEIAAKRRADAVASNMALTGVTTSSSATSAPSSTAASSITSAAPSSSTVINSSQHHNHI